MRFGTMVGAWARARLRKSPLTCNLKITERCNLRCRMCSIWRRGNLAEEMDYLAMRRVCRHLKRLGLGRVVITGGEPLLRDDAEAIVALFARNGFSVSLLSNGTLLDLPRLDALARAGLQDLGLSLDSLHSDVQDDICRHEGVTPRVLEVISSAVRKLPRGIVQVMTTVTPTNIHEIPELVRTVDSMGAYSVINPVNLPAEGDPARLLAGEQDPFGDATFPPEVVHQIYDQLHRMKKEGLRILVSDRFLEASRRYLLTGDYQFRCHAGLHYFTIFSNGAVAACSDLQPALSALDHDFPERFRSAAHQQFARQRAECSGCIYSCWREVSYLLYDPRTMIERGTFMLRQLTQRFRG